MSRYSVHLETPLVPFRYSIRDASSRPVQLLPGGRARSDAGGGVRVRLVRAGELHAEERRRRSGCLLARLHRAGALANLN